MRRRTLFATCVPLLLAGCSILGFDEEGLDELREQRRAWARSAPAAYSFVIMRECFCGEELRGPVTVRVRDGALVSATYADGSSVRADYLRWFPDMEGLFDQLADAYDRADEISVRYDPALHIPTYARIDYQENAVDDELVLRVSGFRADAVPQ